MARGKVEKFHKCAKCGDMKKTVRRRGEYKGWCYGCIQKKEGIKKDPTPEEIEARKQEIYDGEAADSHGRPIKGWSDETFYHRASVDIGEVEIQEAEILTRAGGVHSSDES